MRRVSLIVLFCLLAAGTALAQNIQTVAGGGPNNMPALDANLYIPAGGAIGPSGDRYIVAVDANRVYKVDSSGNLTVFAGNGTYGFSGDGGPATSASLKFPWAAAVDGAGNVYIADGANGRIRKVDASGTISTVAGNGAYGFSGDGGPATSASLDGPTGVAVDGTGNLYIADEGNQRIRKVDTSGTISTVAGNGTAGFSGDGGPAASTELYDPFGVAIDGAGNLYIADQANQRIRKVDTSGNISTVAGNGTYGFSGDGGPATSAELFNPFGVAVDGAGNLYIADAYNQRIRKVDTSGNISTVAGNGTAGYSGDGGPATSASLLDPADVAPDGVGNLYIADSDNSRIRKMDASGNISTVAGYGAAISLGDGGPATSAGLAGPRGVAVDGAGNLYIADTSNQRIRKVDLGGIITTVAGNGTYGFSGDGGPATSAELSSPFGVAVDSAGNLFIADLSNQRIRKVDISGNISTVAGNGTQGFSGDGGPATSASLWGPTGVAMDAAGNLYIADQSNNRIRKVDTSGNISTVAGNGTQGFSGDGGPAASTELYYPYGVAVDGAGNLYIADQANQRIRKVDTSGNISTVAGNGTYGFSGDGGPATSAWLASPAGVAVDGAGNLYFADFSNQRVREVAGAASAPAATISPTSLTFGSVPVGTQTTAQTLTLTSSGIGPLGISAVSASGDFLETDNCASTSLAAGNSCTIQVRFMPTAAGLRTGTLTITDNAADSPQSVALSGTGTDFSVSASPSSETVKAGKSAGYTLTVTPESGFTGTVTLGCTGAPSQASCKISPPSAKLNGSKALTSSVTVSTGSGKKLTPTGTYTLTLTGASGSLSHSTTVTLTVQ
jgi:Cep192 domain 4/NHL repeat